MKRGKKLILLALVLALLVVGIWAVNGLKSEEAAGAVEEEAETVEKTIFSLDPAAVQTLRWTYEGKTMTFDRIGDTWVFAMDPAFPVRPAALDKMIEMLTDVKEEVFIGVQEDLEQYGLADAVIAVQVTTEQTQTILFGNTAKYGSSAYAMLEDGNIYLVDLAIPRALKKTLEDVVQVETLPNLAGSDLAGSNLSFATCAKYVMEESELAPYGLLEPQKVSVTCKDGTVLNLEFATGEDTYYYVRMTDSRLVYEITEAAYNKLVKLAGTEE